MIYKKFIKPLLLSAAAVLICAAAVSLPEMPFFAESLTSDERAAYETIRTAVINCEKSVTIETPLTAEFWQFFIELSDNQDPLCFNIKSVRPALYENSFRLDFTYYYDKASYEKATAAANKAADEIIAGFTPDMSEREKTAFVYSALRQKARYNPNAVYADNFYGVFRAGEAGAEGFAEAFSFVLTRAGIENTIARGTFPGGAVLVFNRVTLGGETKNVCVPAEGYFLVDDSVITSIVTLG
jgi:hypothetical protein